MIQYTPGYLADASAPWHLLGDPKILDTREEKIDAGALRVYEPKRVEFLFSATSPHHREQLAERLDTMCPRPRSRKTHALGRDSPIPTDLTRPTSQCRLARPTEATAAHHGLTVLQVDDDFTIVSRVLPELDEQDLILQPVDRDFAVR